MYTTTNRCSTHRDALTPYKFCIKETLIVIGLNQECETNGILFSVLTNESMFKPYTLRFYVS